VTLGLIASFAARRFFEAGPGEAALAGIGLGIGALLFAGSLDDRFDTWWPGVPAASPAPRSPPPPRAPSSAASAAGWTTRPRPRCPSTPRAPGSCWRASASSSRRWRSWARAAWRAPRPQPPPRGREVRRAAHPAVSPAGPRKLVLAVIDGMKPSSLERAMQTGRAPVLRAMAERGTYVPECAALFPSVTPVCATAIATGVRQDRHHIPG
jgi:hypothetical protein